MKQSKCYTCDKLTHNLITANCSHKICFNCVKNNKNTHKCSYCTAISASKHKLLNGLSPLRREKLQKQREQQKTTKTKSIQSKKHQHTSPHIERSTRRSQVHIQSCSNYVQNSISQEGRQQIKLLCKQHHQPLTLFSKTTKEAICSICLCSKPKYNQEIMPIKGAQNYLKRENHTQREESRVILNDIQKCQKIMKVNCQQFQLYYGSHVKVIEEIFAQLHQQLEEKQRELKQKVDLLFMKKLTQCKQIQQDLSYLIETLQTYREENKETNTLSESLYVYSSFKVIKKTMKTLNLDYVNYSNKNINLLQYNKGPYENALTHLIKLNEELPLKQEELISQSRRKNKSASSRNSLSAKKQAANSYSNRKKGSSVYENVLNEKIGLGSFMHHDGKIHQHEESAGKSSHYQDSYQKLCRQHNNSLQTYINQSIQRQVPSHNNSTPSYFNKSGCKVSQKEGILSASNAFEYELKTPIKRMVNDNERSKKVESVNENSEEKGRSYDKNLKRSNELNLILGGSVSSGLRTNEEERSLYKRLLKSRFTRQSLQEQEQQLGSEQKRENGQIVENRECKTEQDEEYVAKV